jgi:hypothetical protein
VRRLIQLRRDNPALRPRRFARDAHVVPSASVIDWYDENGETMSIERWTDPAHRTLQYDAASTPEEEDPNRILLVVHGTERAVDVTLPTIDGVAATCRSGRACRIVPTRPSRCSPRAMSSPCREPRCTCSGCNDATRTPVVCPFGFGGRFESWLRRRAPLLPFLLARRRCAALHRFRYARSPRGAA